MFSKAPQWALPLFSNFHLGVLLIYSSEKQRKFHSRLGRPLYVCWWNDAVAVHESEMNDWINTLYIEKGMRIVLIDEIWKRECESVRVYVWTFDSIQFHWSNQLKMPILQWYSFSLPISLENFPQLPISFNSIWIVFHWKSIICISAIVTKSNLIFFFLFSS